MIIGQIWTFYKIKPCEIPYFKLSFANMTIPLDPQSILIYSALALFIILIGLVIHLEIKVRRLLAGKNGKSLEDSIVAIKKGLDEEVRFKRDMEKYLTQVEKRLSRSTRGVATVRFNAFQGTGTGGNQSFATAYLNEVGEGVIISSLNARERVSIFAKPIKKFTSDFELSPEEAEALEQAKQSLSV